MVSNGFPDQDCFIAMALAYAGRHLCGTLLTITRPPPTSPSALGQDLGQGQLGPHEDVPRGGAREAPRHAALPLRLAPRLGRAPPRAARGLPRAERRALGARARDGRPWRRRPARERVGRLLWDPGAVGVRGGEGGGDKEAGRGRAVVWAWDPACAV